MDKKEVCHELRRLLEEFEYLTENGSNDYKRLDSVRISIIKLCNLLDGMDRP